MADEMESSTADYSEHEASPNSECSGNTVNPQDKNSEASYPGTRYGQNGTHPGQGDNSSDRIITSA
jgi:hypothetical protein